MMLKAKYTQQEARKMAETLDRVHYHLIVGPQVRIHGRSFIDELQEICAEDVLKGIEDAAARR